MPPRSLFYFILGAAATVSLSAQSARPPANSFAFFQPAVNLSAGDLRALDAGAAVVRMLPAVSGEAVVFSAIEVDVSSEQFAAWMRNIVELKKNPGVLGSGRFSDDPCLEDLQALTIDDGDLNDIRACRPGKCGLKLSSPEISRLQRVISEAPKDWKARVQMELRRVMLQRVQTYLSVGHTPDALYADKDKPVSLARTFSGILNRSTYLTRGYPGLAHYLEHYPAATLPGVESYLYWSKERIAGKSQISVTHLSLVRPGDPSLPLAIVAGKQVFATHFVNGALSLTTLLKGRADGRNYLAYVSRSEVDLLSGFFGGLARRVLSSRVSSEAPEILRSLRTRLEAAPPTTTAR